MQIKRQNLTPTSIKLSILADQKALDAIKQIVLSRLSDDIKLPGFREGKAPANLVERHIDSEKLQNDFLNEALNQLYSQAVRNEKIKVVAEPQITLTKFVPFTTLEFSAEMEIISDIILGDYKNVKINPPKIEVSPKEVDQILDNLRLRSAAKVKVSRAAKTGDEVIIDFKGTDAKTKAVIEGAEGQDYPLVIGSKSFIPGFEAKLIGLKAGRKKSFDIVFPANYGVAPLQNRKVKFEVEIKAVNELTKPKLDDDLAKVSGPFKTLTELKTDIKEQLKKEKQTEVNQALDNELLQAIADKSQVAIPGRLIEDEVERLEEEEKRNIVYRGQTWQEHLTGEGLNEEEHRNRQRPTAETRIKIGLLLGEIAEKEQIEVSEKELNSKLTELKQQYTDANMQAELDKPENRRDIYSRLLIEKTINRLRQLNLNK